MFREMRRKGQALSLEECSKILKQGTSGVLALSGDENYPYAVPISFVYDGTKLYFHCAKSGHKLDAIQRNRKVSFCVIGQDSVVPGAYTTHYKSVVVFGKMRILEEAEKRNAIEKLAAKYAPDDDGIRRQSAIDSGWMSLCVLEMTIDHMTGKESMELIRARLQEKESLQR